jgi:uncharacterized repeat protein (TIGR02543 family)
VYSIGVSESGTYAFPAATAGYGAQTARTVTVSNTGNQATGALTVAKSGANADSFTVSMTSLASIAVEGSDSFTVVPNTGLAAGTYAAAVTVSGGNSISASFNVSFTVNPPNATFYTVTFNADGGAPASSTAQTASGGTVSLPASNPAKSGYTFGGWYTEANGGGAAFTATTQVTADITVYAKWLSANANLASLSLDAGTLNPLFSANTTAYTALVSSTTGSVTVTVTVADSKAAVSQSPTTNPVSLSGNSTVITITVTAEDGSTTKDYTITVHKTTETTVVNVVIGRADERIDLTRNTEKDLSREAGNTLRLTAPEGYDSYVWLVDGDTYGYDTISNRIIELNANWYSHSYGTHSVLLIYDKDGIQYGCEVLFRVVR